MTKNTLQQYIGHVLAQLEADQKVQKRYKVYKDTLIRMLVERIIAAKERSALKDKISRMLEQAIPNSRLFAIYTDFVKLSEIIQHSVVDTLKKYFKQERLDGFYSDFESMLQFARFIVRLAFVLTRMKRNPNKAFKEHLAEAVEEVVNDYPVIKKSFMSRRYRTMFFARFGQDENAIHIIAQRISEVLVYDVVLDNNQVAATLSRQISVECIQSSTTL